MFILSLETCPLPVTLIKEEKDKKTETQINWVICLRPPIKTGAEAALPLVLKPHPALAPLYNATHQRIPCIGSGKERTGMLKGYVNDQDSHTCLRVHTEFVTKIAFISWLQKRAGIRCVWNYGGVAEYDQTPPNHRLSSVCDLIPRRCEATRYRNIMWTAGF